LLPANGIFGPDATVPREVVGVAFAPDGTRLATASNNSREWERAAPDGTPMMDVIHDGTAKLWDVASGTQVQALHHQDTVVEGASRTTPPPLFPGGSKMVGVAFAPDGTCLATASQDGRVRLWEVASGTELHTLHHQDTVLGVAFAPDGTRLATASRNGSAQVWDVASGIVLDTLHHERAVVGVAFTPDGTRLATASEDNTARVWELRSDVMLLAIARTRVDRQLTTDERRMAGLPS
jgi:WD40 repeat protein